MIESFQSCLGSHFYETKTSAKILKHKEVVLDAIDFSAIKETQILIKGSRGMALERLLDKL